MADASRDCDEIRHLLATYTYEGDRGRIDRLAACFATSGVLEFPGTVATGPAAISATLGKGGSPDARRTFLRHHITNPLIEVAGNEASARSYFAVWSNHGPDHAGTYSDKLVRTDEGWRFAHRLVRIDWQSENSLFARMATR